MKVGKGTVIWHPEKSVICDGATIGADCVLHSPIWIGKEVVIGDRVKIQAFAFIPDGVTIGDDVFIGPHVTFCNDRYPPSGKLEHTYVENGVSIGANATILPGLLLNHHCYIGAGSVVTVSVSAYNTVVGSPARPIADREAWA